MALNDFGVGCKLDTCIFFPMDLLEAAVSLFLSFVLFINFLCMFVKLNKWGP